MPEYSGNKNTVINWLQQIINYHGLKVAKSYDDFVVETDIPGLLSNQNLLLGYPATTPTGPDLGVESRKLRVEEIVGPLAPLFEKLKNGVNVNSINYSIDIEGTKIYLRVKKEGSEYSLMINVDGPTESTKNWITRTLCAIVENT